MLRPPQNRSDAPIIFVHEDDPAWDLARVKEEQAALGDHAKNHPVAQYFGGWTRYDLDAKGTLADGRVVTAREYLDEAQQPTMWKLRRLTWDQWYEVHPVVEKAWRSGERPFAGYIKACLYGLERVDNGPTFDMPAGRMSTADLAKLHEMSQANDIDLAYDIGEAVYQASMPLSESEKKPAAARLGVR